MNHAINFINGTSCLNVQLLPSLTMNTKSHLFSRPEKNHFLRRSHDRGRAKSNSFRFLCMGMRFWRSDKNMNFNSNHRTTATWRTCYEKSLRISPVTNTHVTLISIDEESLGSQSMFISRKYFVRFARIMNLFSSPQKTSQELTLRMRLRWGWEGKEEQTRETTFQVLLLTFLVRKKRNTKQKAETIFGNRLGRRAAVTATEKGTHKM